MRGLIHACLEHRWTIVGLSILLLAFGLRILDDASFDAFPEFASPRVEIQTEAPGMSSEEVETLVTNPLEATLAGIPKLEHIRSKSVLGLSSVVLLFGREVDLVAARALVQERLSQAIARLPVLAKAPVMLAPLSSTSRVMKIGMWSPKASQMELTDLARWTVRPRLLAVPGVANVAIWGERDRQLQVLVNPERLAALGSNLDQVLAATREAVTPRAGGFVDTPSQRLPVIHPQMVQGAEDLARVPLALAASQGVSPSGSSAPAPASTVPSTVRSNLRIGDVAEVVEQHPAPIGDALVTQGAGLLLIVEKQPDGNTLAVTKGVDAALAGLKPGLPNIEIDATIFRPAGFIERALDNLGHAMMVGCVLVVLVLLLFLWDVRTALISVTAIPLSLLAAAAVLTAFGRTIDTMVITGLVIALGEVVDDAIIDVENIHRRLHETKPATLAAKLKVVLEASLEVRSAIVYASIVVVLVFIPVLLLEGVAGAFFRPLALSYGLAVLASTAVALTVTPVLSLLLLSSSAERTTRSPLYAWIAPRYATLVKHALERPKAWLVGGSVALALTIVSSFALKEQFLPAFQENDLLMHWIARPGTSLEAVQRSANRAREELLKVPGVRNFGAHIGRAEVADEVVGPNFAELWVSVDPEANLAAATAHIQEVVHRHPGVYRDVQTYLQERIREVLSGGSGAIIVRLYGTQLSALRSSAKTLARQIGEVPGVAHAKPESQVLVPQIEIRPNLARCAALGIDPGLVRARASTLVQGERVGQLARGNQPVDVVIWGTSDVRADLSSIQNLLLDLGGGRVVSLRDVADVRIAPMQNTITHDATSRKTDVVVDLTAGADLRDVSDRVHAVLNAFPQPPGQHFEMLGEHQASSQARSRLLIAALFALVGIALVLHADFRSARLTLLVLASLPFALVGGVAAVFGTGGVVSLGTLVGLVTVLGIAARNGIMLVSHLRQLEDEGMVFGPELVGRGATERVLPILMTALATGLALVPLVWRGLAPGHEIEHPMAVVILGGIVSSTILNLLVLPALYLRYGRRTQEAPATSV